MDTWSIYDSRCFIDKGWVKRNDFPCETTRYFCLDPGGSDNLGETGSEARGPASNRCRTWYPGNLVVIYLINQSWPGDAMGNKWKQQWWSSTVLLFPCLSGTPSRKFFLGGWEPLMPLTLLSSWTRAGSSIACCCPARLHPCGSTACETQRLTDVLWRAQGRLVWSCMFKSGIATGPRCWCWHLILPVEWS